MHELKVGDKVQDDSLIILDEDRLCYSVRSVSNGGVGVRTISKALLAEWVEAYKQTPNAPAQEVRTKLVGKSEVDKFEYGYAGTLAKLAKMILGQTPIVRAKPDYSTEFSRWFAENRGKGKDTTAKKYISYFKTLTDTYQEPTNSYWHGLYRVMYSADAEKDVIEIGESAEFERIYGGIVAALEEKVKGVGMTDEGFQRAIDWYWKPEVKSHTCVTSALNAYLDFLKWRDAHQKPTEVLSKNVDRLSVALKMFEERRGLAATENDGTYDEKTAQIRTQGQIIDGDYLVRCDYASFRKTLHDRQVANSYFTKHTDEDKRKLGEFMAAVRNDPKDVSYYIDKENWPAIAGIGAMLLTAFLTRVRPDLYAFYSNPMFAVVKLLGMTRDDKLPQMTLNSYNTYKGIQTIIRDRMREMGIKAENGNDADYLTVNEFTWIVYANLDLFKDAMPTEDRLPELPSANLLTIALKIFADRREDDGEGGWLEMGRAVNGRIREYFDPLTEESISAFGKEQIEELFCGKKSADGKVELETMWSGKNGQGWSHIKKGLDDGKLSEIVGYLVALKHGLEIVPQFCLPNFDWHYGFGRSVISELLMKFHPENCIKHGERSHNALAWLRLIDFSWERKYSSEEYSQVCGAAAKILAKMKAMNIPRQINADGSPDTSPPDYLTVNEFLYFVDTNLNKIKEEVMKKQMKSDKPTKYDETKRKKLQFDPASKDDKLLLRLLSALRAKPFAILAGHSGTGKSRYVKKLAYMTCNMDELRTEGKLPGNYLLLQVKPNWHDSTELLGFRNAMDENKYQKTALIEFLFRAYHFKDTPFFLCLDEMNLAPVEQYFAEFLSSMESKEPIPLNDISDKEDNLLELGCEWTDARDYLAAKGFSIPSNLFIVGTVNMDETTNQFSRKVLDRAFTIEMTDVDFASYGKVTEPSYGDTIEEAKIQELLNGPKSVAKLDDDDIVEGAPLVKVQKALEPTAFAVAYRFANEYTLLKMAIACFDPEKKMGLDALDQAVLMKVLPRIAGERDYIEMVYGKKEDEGLRKALAGKVDSLKKIEEILKRAKDMSAQYITFWP